MERVFVNEWQAGACSGVEIAQILHHDHHPEGLDFYRVRFAEAAQYTPDKDVGTLATVLRGQLSLQCGQAERLRMVAGTHAYLPPGSKAVFHGEAGTELVLVLAPSAARARGEELLIRDDQFLAACAQTKLPLRWILTPQYLSRRVFLHHDRTLCSRNGNPVSWFHTTMFDVDGLPANDDGEPVFKMSYNYRTEPNVCYEVEGRASVRMARHPYHPGEQRWGPWQAIDGQTTYHLNEDASASEWTVGKGAPRPRRNKHEIRILKGHVSLMCMHDPAPTGAEHHAAGEYSEYGDLSQVLGTAEYKAHLQNLRPLDHMVDVLSTAKARGDASIETLPEWEQYLAGLAAQRDMEAELEKRLRSEGKGREQILRAWMLS
jgi:hypothetical protein